MSVGQAALNDPSGGDRKCVDIEVGGEYSNVFTVSQKIVSNETSNENGVGYLHNNDSLQMIFADQRFPEITAEAGSATYISNFACCHC